VLGFLVPRLRAPQTGVNKALGTGARGASKAPGRLGRWLAKPFRTSSRAANKSASAGRKGRSKLPL
jgi:hypothetical protein